MNNHGFFLSINYKQTNNKTKQTNKPNVIIHNVRQRRVYC